MKKLYYLLLLLCLSVASCDMPLSEDYVQPIMAEEDVPISVALNVNWENNAILLNGWDIAIPYSFSAHGKSIVSIDMTLAGRTVTEHKANGVVYFYPEDLPDGYYTLDCSIIIKSGTGSLADELEAEYYGFQFSIPVLMVKDYQPKNRIRQSTNNDGNLVLEWDEPQSEHLEVENYTIYVSDNHNLETITIPNGTAMYVDKNYVGQEATYSVQANLKDKFTDERLFWQIDSYKMDLQIKLTQKQMANGSRVIEWENPFHSIAKVEMLDLLPNAVLEDGRLTLKPEALGENDWDKTLSIKISFVYPNDPTKQLYQERVEVPLYAHKLIDDSFSDFHYNVHEKTIYAVAQNELRSFREDSYELIQKKKLNTYYSAEFCTSPNSSRVATYTTSENNQSGNDYLVVYKDSNLEELWRKPCLDKRYNGTNRQSIFLTTDNRLVYFANRDSGIYAVVLNALTGDKETEFLLEADSYIYEMAISPDGKKLCYNEGHQVYILDLDNYQVNGRHILMEGYMRQCFFNINRPTEIATTNNVDNSITYWDMDSREKLRTIVPSNSAQMVKIDIYTGNLLLSNNPKLYVASGEDGSILFETYGQDYSLSFINNHLGSYDGLIINLNNYKTK